MHLTHGRDRRHDWNGRLTTTGHHIDILRRQIVFTIDHRDHIRTDRRRGQINHDLTGISHDGIMMFMRACRGGIKHNADILPFRQFLQSLNAFMCSSKTQFLSPGKAV